MKRLVVATVLAGTLVNLAGVSAHASPDVPACIRTGTELVAAASAAATDSLGAGFPHVTEARHSFTRCGHSIVDDVEPFVISEVTESARVVLDTIQEEGDRRQFFLELILCIDLDLCD